MSTIQGSGPALLLEECITGFVEDEPSLHALWAISRYSILIMLSELYSAYGHDSSHAITHRSSESLAKGGYRLASPSWQCRQQEIRDGFRVIWNPDFRIRKQTDKEDAYVDIYSDLITCQTLVLPDTSAVRLYRHGVITVGQLRDSLDLFSRVELSKMKLFSGRDQGVKPADSDNTRCYNKIEALCRLIRRYLTIEGNMEENLVDSQITQISKYLQRNKSISEIIPMNSPMQILEKTGLIMHCGNYVLDPLLCLIWKASGYPVCDYTHAYAGVGHIAYTHQARLIAKREYKRFLPDITIGGPHMWQPSICGKRYTDITAVMKSVSSERKVDLEKASCSILFVSSGQYRKNEKSIKQFLSVVNNCIMTWKTDRHILVTVKIRLHPKEQNEDDLMNQVSIHEDLRSCDVVIGEFSTCLLEAEEMGKKVFVIKSSLHPLVYTSIQGQKIRGYTVDEGERVGREIAEYMSIA